MIRNTFKKLQGEKNPKNVEEKVEDFSDDDDFVEVEKWENASNKTESDDESETADPSMQFPSKSKNSTLVPDPILSGAMKNLADSGCFQDAMMDHAEDNLIGKEFENENERAPPAVSCTSSISDVADLELSQDLSVPSMAGMPSLEGLEEPKEGSITTLERSEKDSISCQTPVAQPIPFAAPKEQDLNVSSRYYGGQGGRPFNTGHSLDGIHRLAVNYGALVDGIIITYGNQAVRAFGGSGGTQKSIQFRANEYIVSVRVRYSRTLVQCLTFYTNTGRQLGPCGGKGSPFLLCDVGAANQVLVEAPEGYKLVGLKGREGDFLDSIGFNWGPIEPPRISRSAPTTLTSTQCFGGKGGVSFDSRDLNAGGIRSIFVRAGNIVDGISFMYSDRVDKFGGTSGSEETLHLLKQEAIVEVCVKYNRAVVQCLTFRTNRGRLLGPCGGNGGLFLPGGMDGRQVVLKAPEGSVLVGIHGCAGRYLDSIGFHWGPVMAKEDLKGEA